MMRILKRIIIWLLFILLGAAILLYIYFQFQKPIYSGTVEFPDLDSTVVTYFDDQGVPHIYGNKEEDVFYVLGYLHAKERLFQMELIRRVSSGRLSEIFGSKTLEADKFFRMLGLDQRAEESVRAFKLSADTLWKRDMIAYLDGINQYIERKRKRFEFLLLDIPKEEFTLKDLYLIADYMAFNFQMAFKTDPLMSRIERNHGKKYLADLGIIIGEQIPDSSVMVTFDSVMSSLEEIIPVKAWSGSNAWAVSSGRSKSGKVLFENDTHVGVQQPAVWYEAHLECRDFSIYGSFLAGFPFPVLGHNRFHAWGLTILENDDLDFYAEQVNPEDSNFVLINGKHERIQVREEVIKVKDSTDVIIQCRSTSHGPVCSDVLGDFSSVTTSPVSICWTLLKFPDNLPEITWQMSHARSMEQFRDAVSMIAAPGLNVIYADADNNIAWYTAAKFVIRPQGVNANLVLDGSGKHDWLGFYDFNVNPKSENPGRGVVLSANNPPSKDSMDLFPGYYVPEDRYVRINQFFYAKKFLNHTDMQNMNTDIVNDVAVQCARAMLAKLSGAVKLRSHIHTRASEIVDRWNGSHELNDVAPVIYYKWLYHVFHDAFSDELGEKDFEAFLKTHIQKSMIKPFLLNDSSVWWDNDSTKEKIETSKEIVEDAFDKTISELNEQFGYNPEKWLWRKVHYLEIEHPVGRQKPLDKIFNIGPYPVVGGIETINNQSFDLSAKGMYKVNLAPALRRTIDFADPENGYSISPSGQSGSFMSGFYRDQTKRYINRKVRKEMMNRNEIVKNYYSRMFFVPQR